MVSKALWDKGAERVTTAGQKQVQNTSEGAQGNVQQPPSSSSVLPFPAERSAQPSLGESLSLEFLMLLSLMLGLALRGFLIGGTPQIVCCSQSPSPKKRGGE